MEVSGQLRGPVALLPGKEARYPLSRRLGEDIGAGLDDLEKILLVPGIEQWYLGDSAHRSATITTTQPLTESHINTEQGIQCSLTHWKQKKTRCTRSVQIISERFFIYFLGSPASYSVLSPSKYAPWLLIHRSQRFFHFRKQSWKAFFGIARRSSGEFSFISSTD
jgi:hypothetical protein